MPAERTQQTDTGVLQDLLDVTNEFRDLIGIETLKALPFLTAVPSSATECLIALAIDHECRVEYGEKDTYYGYPEWDSSADDSKTFHEGGAVIFEDSEQGNHDAAILAKQLGVEVLPKGPGYDENDRNIVPLPDKYARVAVQFDSDSLRRTLEDAAQELWPWEFVQDEAESTPDQS